MRCTELLLEAGADCKGAWTIEEENCYGAATKTPVPALLIAASVFDWDEEAGNQLVRLLVAGGASSTRLDMRLQSLLHLGVMDGNHKFVKALLEASPEVRLAHLKLKPPV